MTDGIYVAVKLNTFPRVIILYLEKIILPVTASFPQKKMDCQQQVYVPLFNFTAFKEVGLM